MNDELSDYLTKELGFKPKNHLPGLDRAVSAFLGKHLLQMRPIQEQAIDVIYAGKDVLIISATASGKTEAAFIPISAQLVVNPSHVALYLAPTRALLNDMLKRLQAPMHELGLDIKKRHGDISLPSNTASVRILLTTPESLDILLSRHNKILDHINYVILDEIHQLYGNPRGDQLMFLLQRLEKNTGKPIQKIGLSATIGNPEDISKWLCPQGEAAEIIRSDEKKDIVGDFHLLSDLPQLRKIIGDSKCKKILCFENSRRSCDDTFLILKDIEPYQSFIHYSTLTKEQREYVERGFKTSQMAICVATSTLELGIDIGSIEKVIMIEPPFSVSSFMQRIGRGGRRGSKTEVSFLPKNTMDLLRSFAMLRLGDQGTVEIADAGKPYSVLIQQLFSILAGKKKLLIHSEELVETFSKLTWLTRDDFNVIFEKLLDASLLRRESKYLYGVGPKLERLIEDKAIFTNIIGTETGIPIFHDGRLLTKLPLRPNQIKYGNVVLYAGRYWQIVSISDEGLGVRLSKPVSDPIRPVFGSKGLFKTSFLLAQGIRDILVNRPSFEPHFVDEKCRILLNRMYEGSPIIQNGDHSIWVENAGGNHIYYTFAGSLGNLFIQLLMAKHGIICKPMQNADGIAIVSNEPLNFNLIPEDLSEINNFLFSHWRHLSNQTTVGPFFDYLPNSLKREEIISRIINLSLIESIMHFHGSEIIPVNLDLS